MCTIENSTIGKFAGLGWDSLNPGIAHWHVHWYGDYPFISRELGKTRVLLCFLKNSTTEQGKMIILFLSRKFSLQKHVKMRKTRQSSRGQGFSLPGCHIFHPSIHPSGYSREDYHQQHGFLAQTIHIRSMCVGIDTTMPGAGRWNRKDSDFVLHLVTSFDGFRYSGESRIQYNARFLLWGNGYGLVEYQFQQRMYSTRWWRGIGCERRI